MPERIKPIIGVAARSLKEALIHYWPVAHAGYEQAEANTLLTPRIAFERAGFHVGGLTCSL